VEVKKLATGGKDVRKLATGGKDAITNVNVVRKNVNSDAIKNADARKRKIINSGSAISGAWAAGALKACSNFRRVKY
jgi:hypothetical protein